MSPEGDKKRRLTDRINSDAIPKPKKQDHYSEWQPEGDIDGPEVPFRGPLVHKHRRADDPKLPDSS